MQIVLNGETTTTTAETLSQLVIELSLGKRMIAMERNLEVVPKSEYDNTRLCENDCIELVHMIGGG